MDTENKREKNPFYQTWMTIVYSQTELRIIDVINPQHCMLLQLSEDALLGKTLEELQMIASGPNKKPAIVIAKNIRKAVRENRNVYFEYATTHKDNSVTYAVCYAEKGTDGLLYVNVIKIDEENIFEAREGFTNYVIDITMNNISVGVFMRHIDADGTKKYILFNDVAKEFYECTDILQSKYWDQQEDDLADEKAMSLRDPLKIEKVIRDDNGIILKWLVFTKKKINSRTSGFYMITTIIDITQRRKNEILLEQQFALLDSMYEHLPVGISIYDKEGSLLAINQKDIEVFGVEDSKSVLGLNLFDDPNTPEQIKEKLRKGEDVSYELEYDFHLTNLSYFKTSKTEQPTLLIKSVIIRDKKGRCDGYLQISEDITERKKIEKQLWQKHKLIETIYNTIPIGVEVYDSNGKLIEVNEHDMRMMGVRSKETVIGVDFFENPNISEEIKEKTRKGDDLEYTLDYNFDLARDYYNPLVSQKMYLNIKTSPLRNENNVMEGFLLVNQDLTERTERELSYKQIATKFSTMFDSMSNGVEIYDKEGQLIDCNRSDLKIFGIDSKEEYIRNKINIIDNPNVSPENLERLFAGEEVMLCLEYDFDLVRKRNRYVTTKSGRINIEVKLAPMILDDGELFGFVAEINDVSNDILNRKRLEEANFKSMLVLNNLASGLVYMDEDYCVVWENVSLVKGNPRANKYCVGKKCYETMWGRTSPCPNCVLKEVERTGKPSAITAVEENGTALEITVSVVKNTQEETIGYICRLDDVTESYNDKIEIERTRKDLNLALTASNMVVWTYDVERELFYILEGNTLVNKGLTMKENLQKLHPDDCRMQLELFDLLISGKQTDASALFRYIQPDGTYRHYESWMLTQDRDGRVIAITGTQKDITEQIEYQQELVRLKEESTSANQILNEIIDRVPGGMYIKDASKDFTYLKANKAFCEIAGKQQEQVVGHTDFEVFDQESAEKYRSYDLKLVEGEQMVSYPSTPIINGVQEYWHVNKSILITQDGKKLILGIATNVTKFHAVNKELQLAKEKAEQSDKLKSAFLANMSHEIRTPLNAIVGFSELLQSSDDKKEQAEFIHIINQNNELLLRLIGDILDLSKIESGLIELKPEKFDLSSVFNEVFATSKVRCTNPDIEFKCVNPYSKCIVYLDKNRLLQIGINFVTNAIKYTIKGHITIGYEYKNQGIRIYVEDTGIGIAKEKQHLLFHRFEKLDDFAQGTGLGLAICKAIVTAKKGEIGFHSEEGKGSTFWAWVPCKVETSDELEELDTHIITTDSPSKLQICHKKNKSLSILVAEDIDSNYMLIQAILCHCKLTRAVNGKQAVELAAQQRFDVILMDMRMPVMNGLEAVSAIREFDKEIQIIALTANVFDSDKDEALKVGCNGFITKPLNKQKLEELLEMD